MLRNIGAIVSGLVAWIVIVSVIDRLMRLSWPEYAVAFPTMTFTLQMMFARLIEAAIATSAAGFINRLIPRTPLWPAAAQGAIIFLVFLPEHYKLWHNFPVWYHLTFLGYLIPFTILGAAFARTQGAKALDSPLSSRSL